MSSNSSRILVILQQHWKIAGPFLLRDYHYTVVSKSCESSRIAEVGISLIRFLWQIYLLHVNELFLFY